MTAVNPENRMLLPTFILLYLGELPISGSLTFDTGPPASRSSRQNRLEGCIGDNINFHSRGANSGWSLKHLSEM